ncbi:MULTISPECIES: TRAP transporter large permease [Rhodobacterales]|uniref:TRAP transporter large permease protein n=1 Tax=Rhodobacter flavimaris TaxID=2907145 RepID=A0ABS8Z2K4_9RHOB|nr:TRAP transporter large permease [Sinirhodobacter sp. WL0062]MCE5975093.1 TRAP transporter large permease [Sinirhodobacter sp. WL0062]
MDPSSIGLYGFALVVLLLAIRVPIAFVLTGVASIGTFLVFATRGGNWMPERALNPTSSMVVNSFFELIHSYDLSMIPLFVALGNIAYHAGITTRIYNSANVWLRGLPGGVGIASVVGCAGFSAISGSSVACASTMGRICVPEMLRLGYDRRLATASVAAGGTLGSLIPPSVLFILYGIFTETSISKLFLAGILPGLLTLAGYVVVITWWAARNPNAAPLDPAPLPAGARRQAAIASWPAVLLFGVIIGGIYGGIFTATEAAAISVVLTALIGLVQRTLGLRQLWVAIRTSLEQTAAIFLIAASAKIFVSFVALTGAAALVAEWVAGMDLSPLVLMLFIVILYLFLGMLLDPVGIIVLTLPFVIPLVEHMHMDLIWFGVIVVKLLEIGLITPPVGLNVFVIGSVAGRSVKVDDIFSGVLRFLLMDIVVLALLVAFPIISTLILNGL